LLVAVPEENSDISANANSGAGGFIQITAQGIFGLERRSVLTPLRAYPKTLIDLTVIQAQAKCSIAR
jgi:large exoprotein involved in heme utilization and adhesion